MCLDDRFVGPFGVAVEDRNQMPGAVKERAQSTFVVLMVEIGIVGVRMFVIVVGHVLDAIVQIA